MNREDDTKWPQKNKDGRQELEIRMGSEHISFEVRLTQRALCFQSLVANVSVDCQDRLASGCERVGRPRRTAGVLLSGARFEGARVLAHFIAL